MKIDLKAIIKSRETLLEAVKKSCVSLEYVPMYYSDREIVFAALQNKDSFHYVDPELRNDKEFVLLCMEHTHAWTVFEHASDTLKADVDVILTALANHWNFEIFQFAKGPTIEDKYIVSLVWEKAFSIDRKTKPFSVLTKNAKGYFNSIEDALEYKNWVDSIRNEAKNRTGGTTEEDALIW